MFLKSLGVSLGYANSVHHIPPSEVSWFLFGFLFAQPRWVFCGGKVLTWSYVSLLLFEMNAEVGP